MRDHLRTRHYSIRTEAAYLDWVRRFILFHDKRHPAEMGAVEVAAFLTHLAVDRQVLASTQNQAKSAILYLYKEVPQVQLALWNEVVQARHPGGCWNGIKHKGPSPGLCCHGLQRYYSAASAAISPRYANSLTGTQLQNRFRSPYTLSTRPTGDQYLAWRKAATG